MAASSKKTPPAIEDIAAATLRGDVRDFLMGWFRNTPKPWPQMSEAEQKNFASAADRQAETLVRAVTNLVGSQGFRSFAVSVGDFQKKANRLEAKISAPYSRENLIEMAEAGEAGPIVLSMVSLEQFEGERAPAKVMPDQPDLIDDEGDGAQQEQQAASGETQEADLAAGETFDPETGEIITVEPEDGQRQGERRLLTYEGSGTERGDVEQPDLSGGPGDDLAARYQAGALTGAELAAMTPEQRESAELLQGMRQHDASHAERIDGDESDGAEEAPKRRRRRTAEQRTADNARAAETGRMI